MLAPRCERCGSCLRPVPEDSIDQVVAEEKERPSPPPSKSADVTGPFAAMVVVPLLVPYLGIHLGPFVFGVPMVALIFAAVRAAVALRKSESSVDRWVWRLLVLAAAFAAVASAVAMVTMQLGLGLAAYYVGTAASVLALAAATVLATDRLAGVRPDRVIDAVLLGMVLASVSTYFVILPGIERGDVALTLTFAVDVLALLLTSLAAIARSDPRARRVAWALAVTFGFAAVGDGLVSAAATGAIHPGSAPTALLWAVAGFALAWAADEQLAPHRAGVRAKRNPIQKHRWFVARVALPLVAVLAFPIVAGTLWITRHSLDLAGALIFGGAFLLALVFAFGRQAYLVVDNRRAAVRERRLRDEALRRTEQLEALTGLATTMTQTLEEAPIVEQALTVLHLAARATSSALHVHEGDTLVLRAATGRWNDERPWADRPSNGTPVQVRGGRNVVRMPIAARGHDIGAVTLIRPLEDAVTGDELDLLKLLVDELAVAIQNARDYREKLEQAIRDPLTGVYNRRFLFEAFEKEVRRHERYGSEVSVVLFDVDDFKQVNDTYGHAEGDEVLRKLATLVDQLIRPVDSFARIGGEEFAILLPETSQLDALLVAERVRASISRAQLLPDRRVTVSAGVASCPHDGNSRDDLHRKADAALYWAKRNGKDLCAVAREVSADEANEAHHAIAHLFALVGLIDAQLRTRDHSESVASYAVAVGQRLGLTGEHILRLRRAAFLHDIGKIGVRSEVLLKPARLTDAEFEEIKAHPGLGARILAQANLHEEANWVGAHHERIDGAGYPLGLRGDEIPLEARILFVADSFEAMTSDRPYRDGRETQEALDELRRCSGTQFDPEVVDALIELVETGELAVLAVRGEQGQAAVRPPSVA
jgi:diguanylate cyclase (GGDEF)-like protein